MSEDISPPILADKGLRKIPRHSGAVYPLEAYGFLLGFASPATLTAALPVGKTSRWRDFSDRFGRLSAALQPAHTLAASLDFEIMGVYHSHSGDYTDVSPLAVVPSEFRDTHICIKPISGGEVDLWPLQFHYRGNRWYASDLPKEHLPRLPRFNPRRIHSAWMRLWHEIDYSNGFNTEQSLTRRCS
jgi:hypothetical protein